MICSSRARFYKTLTWRVTSLQTADCDCQIDVEEREVRYMLLEYGISLLEWMYSVAFHHWINVLKLKCFLFSACLYFHVVWPTLKDLSSVLYYIQCFKCVFPVLYAGQYSLLQLISQQMQTWRFSISHKCSGGKLSSSDGNLRIANTNITYKNSQLWIQF